MTAVVMTRDTIAAIVAHAQAALPNEACGLLLGVTDSDAASDRSLRVVQFAAVPNIAADPERRFVLDPAAMLAAEDDAIASDLAVVGIMHSHPTTPAEPSATDRGDADNYDPEHRFVHVLVSLAENEPVVAAWRLGPNSVLALAVHAN